MFNATAEERSALAFTRVGLGVKDGEISFYKSLKKNIQSLTTTPGLKGYNPKPYLVSQVSRLQGMLETAGIERADVIKIDA